MMRWVHLFLTLMVVPIGLSAQQPLTALGLGPKADSLAESLIGLLTLLNKLNPATYFSAIIFLGLGNFILF